MTATARYRNPVLNADWSDPDVVRVGGDFYLTASSFGRAPGLRRLPHVLTQRLPGSPCAAEVEVRLDGTGPGARAALAMLGDAYAWTGLERAADGTVRLVHRFAEPPAERERDAGTVCPAPGGRARLRIEVAAGARCRFGYDVGDGPRVSSGPVFTATPWRWAGALPGLFAAAPEGPGGAGTATSTRFRIHDL